MWIRFFNWANECVWEGFFQTVNAGVSVGTVGGAFFVGGDSSGELYGEPVGVQRGDRGACCGTSWQEG